MTSIFFNMRSGVAPAQSQALLDELRRRPEVSDAAALRPGSKNEVVQRMFYAQVNENADVDAVLRHLNTRPEVESANAPAERHLIGRP